MSTTIVDLSDYGDMKGRDTYLRNSIHSVKGDGVSASQLVQSFYGVPSGAATTEYELSRLTVSEGAVDDEIGTLTFGVHNGTTMNDVMALNNVSSEITTTTFTMNATDVIASGNVNVGTLQKDDLAEGAQITLVDHATDPSINFILGDLGVSESTPLVITEGTVAVTGILTIGGTDVLDAITDGNPWESTGAVTQLKTAYTSVEVNVVNTYTTAVALDVNGSVRIRGNDLFFYDEPLTTFYSTLAYVEASSEVRLRASRAGDSVVVATSNGTDNTYLDRLTFTDGLGDQSATFTNVNVGIGATPSGTFALEVVGGASLTLGLVTGADIDLAGNNLVNVTQIESSDALAEQARIILTSSATVPQIDFTLGLLDTSEVTVATFTEAEVTLKVATTVDDNLTVTGDLTVQGTTVTFNTATVTVEDINIELANSATLPAEIDGGGITLGVGVTGITTPSLTYSNADSEWKMSIGLNIDAAAALSVGTTTTLSTAGLDLRSDTAYIFIGATQQWRLGMYIDGSGDHFEIAHDDLGTQTTWVTKLDVLE